jgi:hypothetical protein
MGTKGISVKDANGRAVVWCFPTSTRRSIEVLREGMPPDRAALASSCLSDTGIPASRLDAARITFRPSEVPIDTFCGLVSALTREG